MEDNFNSKHIKKYKLIYDTILFFFLFFNIMNTIINIFFKL